MTTYVLTEAETRLVEACERADEIKYEGKDVSGRPITVIRAETLRRILLGLPVCMGAFERPVSLQGPGVRIVNATIEGRLHLDNACAPNGDPLPRVSLIECRIPDTISMLSARIRRLCLKNSYINYLRANDAYIGSKLDLEGVSSVESEIGVDGLPMCWVALRNATIEGGIEARRAHLVGHAARDEFRPFNQRSRYALDLAGARIGGDLRLFPEFKAFGGVNIAGTDVSGSVEAHGAHVTVAEVYAFDCDGAHISGRLSLCGLRSADGKATPFIATGDVHLSHARIDDGLKMYGAQISGRLCANYLHVSCDLDFSGLSGRRDTRNIIEPFICGKDFIVTGAHFEGTIDLRGAQLKKDVNAATCVIGGDLLATHYLHQDVTTVFEPFRLQGNFNLSGSRITGDLDFTGASLDGAFHAEGLQIGGFARLRSDTAPNRARPFTCHSGIEINNAQIGLDLDMSGANIDKEVSAKNIRTGGDVFMGCNDGKQQNWPPVHPFIAHSRIDMSGATISGSLDLYGARLHAGLRCRGTEIKSALVIRLEKVPMPPGRKASIDLTNSSANVMSDGSGGNSNYSDCFILHLEGFTYGRFSMPKDAESKLKGDLRGSSLYDVGAWKNRRAWLSLQYTNPRNVKSSRTEYRADTYNMLYRVLKNNGYTRESTNVLIEKLRQERRLREGNLLDFITIKPAMWLYEVLFGFGLRPIRTIFVFSLFYLSVCGIVRYANFDEYKPGKIASFDWHHIPSQNDILQNAAYYLSLADVKPGVLVTQPVSISRLQHNDKNNKLPEDYVEIDPETGVGRLQEAQCGKRIKPALYALDMIIPAIGFNQTSRCDLSDNASLVWSIVKALTTLLGWILTSITILTLSGIIRRQSEPN